VPRDARSRAARLLDRALESGEIRQDELCRGLAVGAATLDAYRTGLATMPLERQLALADLLLDRAPSLRRDAASLRGQALAAMQFHAGDVERHREPWIAPW
jgi:hypothetical protein